jgi:hypothetical protein
VKYIFHKLSGNTKSARQIPAFYEPVVKFCLNPILSSFFPVFFEELLYAAMWLKLPKGSVLRKKFALLI